jgi:hypothetical protein
MKYLKISVIKIKSLGLMMRRGKSNCKILSHVNLYLSNNIFQEVYMENYYAVLSLSWKQFTCQNI